MNFYLGISNLLPPANEVCEDYVFTRVCLSTGGSTWAGTPPGMYTPLGRKHLPGRYTPWAGTSPWAGTPPGRYTPLGRYTPWQVHGQGRYTPPLEQSMLGDTGNKQTVCILLECILVLVMKLHFTLHVQSYCM